jgi:SAM-dependent methyltransferase
MKHSLITDVHHRLPSARPSRRGVSLPQRDGDMPQWLLNILACPRCKEELRLAGDSGLTCDRCRIDFPSGPAGQPDLRLTGPLKTSLQTEYDPSLIQLPAGLWSMPPTIAASVPKARQTPGRPEADLVAWILDSIRPDAIVLDLGGASNRDRELVGSVGAKYLAVDIGAEDAMVRGDAHAIPLLSNSVDILLCMSVFEHLKNPFLAAQEIKRVLKPNGRLIGIVGFLESVHGLPHGSYFHHSYLGIYTVLTVTGFEVNYLAVSRNWQAIHAIGRAMMPGLPKRLAYLLIRPLQVLQNTLWFAAGMKSGNVAAARSVRERCLAASVHFVASKH